MGQTADQLRQEIEHKRVDAAAKIDQIEAKVQDLPNLAKDTVRGTVDQSINQVKASVDQSLNEARTTVEEKVGQMKQQADVRGQIDQRPLVALGVAFGGGYLLGKVLGGDKSSQGGSAYQTDSSQAHSSGAQEGNDTSGMGISYYENQQRQSSGRRPGQPNAVVSALKQAAHEAGLDGTLSVLSGALVATLTDQFNRTIRETFPDFAKHLEAEGGLGGGRQSGGSSSGGSSSGGSGMGGSSTASSSMGGSGSGAAGSGMSASTLGGSRSGLSGSGTGLGGTTTSGTGGSSTAASDASGRSTP